MQEYWVNVYWNDIMKKEWRGLCHSSIEKAIQNSSNSDVDRYGKLIYRIHIKMKPKLQPKYERLEL